MNKLDTLKNYLRYLVTLKSNKLIRQSSILFSGSFITAMLGIILNILVTNYLEPAQFGEYRYIVNYLLFMNTILLFGWQYSAGRLIALEEENEKEIFGTAFVMTLLSAIVGMVGTLLVILFLDTINSYLLIGCLLLFPSLSLVMFDNLLQGSNSIKLLAKKRLLVPVLNISLIVLTLVLTIEFNVIIAILIYGIAISFTSILVLHKFKARFDKFKVYSKSIIKENKKNGIKVYIGGLFSVAMSQGIVFFTGNFVNMNEYGHFTLAISLSSPLAIVGATVGTILYKKNVHSKFISNKIFSALFLISFMTFIIYIIAIEILFALVYDLSYEPAKNMSILLAFSSLISGTGDTLNRFVGAKGLGQYLLNSSIINGIILVSSTIFLFNIYGIYGVVIGRMLFHICYWATMAFSYKITVQKIK